MNTEQLKEKFLDALDKYAFQVPYDGTNNFYNDSIIDGGKWAWQWFENILKELDTLSPSYPLEFIMYLVGHDKETIIQMFNDWEGKPAPTKTEASDAVERILCAAIWYKDLPLQREVNQTALRPVNIDRGVVFCGYRHPHCMYTMVAVTGLRSVEIGTDAAGSSVQGFLTSKNRFVNRKEGAEILKAYGGKLNYSSKELYSEDLYLMSDEKGNPKTEQAGKEAESILLKLVNMKKHKDSLGKTAYYLENQPLTWAEAFKWYENRKAGKEHIAPSSDAVEQNLCTCEGFLKDMTGEDWRAMYKEAAKENDELRELLAGQQEQQSDSVASHTSSSSNTNQQ